MPRNSQSSSRTVNIDGVVRSADRDEHISLTVATVLRSEGGKALLEYLESITIRSVSPANVEPHALFYLEGMRNVVRILRARIDHADAIKRRQ